MLGPRLTAGQHRLDERHQGLADFPGCGVPQVAGAVIHGVVVDVVSHREHGLDEGGVAGPAEAHSLVAGNVDDQAAGAERVKVGFGEVGHGRVGILQSAVDHDVRLGQETGQRDVAVVEHDKSGVRRSRIEIELHHFDVVNRRCDGSHVAACQNLHVADAQGLQGSDRAAGRGAKTNNHCRQAAPVVPRSTGQRHRVQD